MAMSAATATVKTAAASAAASLLGIINHTMRGNRDQSSAAEEGILRAPFDDIPLSSEKVGEINAIKNDDPELESFKLSWVREARHFSDAAWEHLGRYVATNNFLSEVHFSACVMTDAKMRALFRGMTKSGSLTELDLSENNIGLDGIKAMVPFLMDCPHLSELDFDGNKEMNTEGFELLVASLQGGSIERLRVERCNVGSIMALDRYVLPNLQNLDLGGNHLTGALPSLERFTELRNLYLDRNELGPDGYLAIAKLLGKEGSSLTLLSLCSTGMEDVEAELIAHSLKSNTMLRSLEMRGANGFSQPGLVAFLKLLNDISSIDRTINSNHHITNIGLPKYVRMEHPETVRYMDFSLNMNRMHLNNPYAAGRAKVIGSQLNKQKRMRFSHLQGLNHGTTYVFSQIEPMLLPDVLALVGRKHGLNEFFRMVIATSPDVMSLRRKEEGMEISVSLLKEEVMQMEM